MNDTPRSSAARRASAIARLRSLTIGTAVASVAGVAGFGVIAAATYSGVAATPALVDGAGTTTTTPATTTTTSGTTSTLKATATPTPVRAPAQVTTGSS